MDFQKYFILRFHSILPQEMKNMVNKVLLLSEVLLRESIVSLTSVNASLSNQIIESDCKLTIAFTWNFQNWLFFLWLGTVLSIASLLPQLPSITTFVKNILIEAPEVFGEFVEIIDEKDYGHVSNIFESFIAKVELFFFIFLKSACWFDYCYTQSFMAMLWRNRQ